MNLKQADKILSKPEWIEGLELMSQYRRYEDDSPKGTLAVTIGGDGDTHICITPDRDGGGYDSLRFRMFGGGGRSQRVRKALLLLAAAIKLDNDDSPQGKR
jgi:hypothetical protein